MKAQKERELSERVHFDMLAQETGEVWWGSVTEAGMERLRRRARLLRQALSAYNAPRVLEVGCGTGAFSQYILEACPELHLEGFDISPKSVAIAADRLKEYANAKFSVGSALEMSYASESVDALAGNSVLHHLPIEQCIAELFRVLKTGGLLWFSEPNMMNPQIAVEKNVKVIGRRLQNSPDETAFFRRPLRRLLERCGFTRVDVRPFDFMHPGIPASLMRHVQSIERVLEHLPLFREIGGSLLITAIK